MWGRSGLVVSVLFATACTEANSQDTFNDSHIRADSWSLYRGSVIDPDARIYMATFDSLEKSYDKSGPSYNQTNCEIAEGLFESSPGVTVEYWCEPMSDRESTYAN